MRYLNSLLILILFFVVGCGDKGHDIMNLKMLHGVKHLCCAYRTVADQFVLKKYPAVIEYYNSVTRLCHCCIGMEG